MENPYLSTCDSEDCASCSSDCSSCGGGCVPSDRRTITLTMDDDTEVECAILTSFPVKDKNYIALLPLDENGQAANGEVYIYTFAVDTDGNPLLANIETDEEYEQAAEVFNKIVKLAQLQETVENTEE